MSIFTDRRGIERWTCFATCASGTAIDLVMVATGRTVAEAMHWLANRAQLQAEDRTHEHPRRPPPRRVPSQPVVVPPSDALLEYLDACARILWEPAGEPVRRWLVDQRRLDPDVLRSNRIGADPGPRVLRRAAGLPRCGPGAVFPALDHSHRPCYLQLRYLCPPEGRGKYDNPTAAHGSNPRIANVEPTRSNGGPTVVTEGIADALTAAGAGYRAIAVLGAGLPDRRVAQRVASRAGRVVIAFDADEAGRSGSARLRQLLTNTGRNDVVEIKPPGGDLNTWMVQQGPDAFIGQLRLGIGLAAPLPRGPAGKGRSIA